MIKTETGADTLLVIKTESGADTLLVIKTESGPDTLLVMLKKHFEFYIFNF